MNAMEVETSNSVSASLPPRPRFGALRAHEMSDGQVQFRKVGVPPHRYTPLKKAWLEIYNPVYEQMKIDIRMNLKDLKDRKVELKTRADTPDVSNLQKCADFVHAFMLGFDVTDAIALLRVDELYVDSIEIKDVKTLKGDHKSRAYREAFWQQAYKMKTDAAKLESNLIGLGAVMRDNVGDIKASVCDNVQGAFSSDVMEAMGARLALQVAVEAALRDVILDSDNAKKSDNISKLGLAADIGLTVGKAVTGYSSGSTAIIADAAHSLSRCAKHENRNCKLIFYGNVTFEELLTIYGARLVEQNKAFNVSNDLHNG
uniref:RNase H type-1 domain-containing protein n=1 Tax=Chenopodium quinoa TaxID=63459 RepID=A0A803NB57_CHEQI